MFSTIDFLVWFIGTLFLFSVILMVIRIIALHYRSTEYIEKLPTTLKIILLIVCGFSGVGFDYDFTNSKNIKPISYQGFFCILYLIGTAYSISEFLNDMAGIIYIIAVELVILLVITIGYWRFCIVYSIQK